MRPGLHLTGAHAALALGLFVALPAASWLDGSGQLAWTMFTRTGHYRLEILATEGDGSRPVAPSALAAAAGPAPIARFLAGADHFRHHDVARASLRRHLDAVAALACRVSGADAVDVTLEERATLDAPVEARHARARCAGE